MHRWGYLRQLGPDQIFALNGGDAGVLADRPRLYHMHKRDLWGLKDAIENYRVDVVVLRDEYFLDGLTSRNFTDLVLAYPDTKRLLEKHYEHVADYGFFHIYRRKREEKT